MLGDIMLGKVFTLLVVIVALIIGILAISLTSERLRDLIIIIKFFDAMLPVLGVGALLKYILGIQNS